MPGEDDQGEAPLRQGCLQLEEAFVRESGQLHDTEKPDAVRILAVVRSEATAVGEGLSLRPQNVPLEVCKK